VIRQGGNLPLKPVVITFDDGYLDTYQNAFPILKSYGFQGVAYIITSTLGTKLSYGYMQPDELKALIAAGWEIGSHSISHTELRTSKLGIRNEIEQSRKNLEALLGVPIRTFSYPFGLANPWTEEQVAKYGYDSAVGLDILVNQTPKRLYYLSRREVYRDMTISDFQALLVPGKEEAAGLFNDSTPVPAQK
jgi:peptidoglycan/xylan/chitin deacetylase (PgdA/CDA1 family)